MIRLNIDNGPESVELLRSTYLNRFAVLDGNRDPGGKNRGGKKSDREHGLN